MYVALGVCLLLAEQVFAVMWIDLLVMLRKTKLIIIRKILRDFYTAFTV